MKERLENRLTQLKSELEAGEKLMAELNSKQATLQQTMLRISGAIQVLQEMLEQEKGAQAPGATTLTDTGASPPRP